MPARRPAEGRFQLAAVQLQEVGLVRGIGLGLILPGGVAAPGPAEQIHQRAGGDAVAVVGAYVIVACKAAVLVLALLNITFIYSN